MTAERWQRMEELFTQALERPASERAAFLAGALEGDDELRLEVERLLATHGQASGFLEPDGNALYYASERDGYRCLWVQRLDAATKRPVGEAQVLQHFHDARASLKDIQARFQLRHRPRQSGVRIGRADGPDLDDEVIRLL
jgi:hypothetical protein